MADIFLNKNLHKLKNFTGGVKIALKKSQGAVLMRLKGDTNAEGSMKVAVYLAIAVSVLLGGCGDFMPGPQKNIVDYRIQEDRYEILVVERDGISEKEARKMARKRAKALTMEKGYHYYTVDSDEEIVVAKQGWGESAMENFFNKRYMNRDNKLPRKTLLGIRLRISCYVEEPCCHSFNVSEEIDLPEPVCEIPCPN